jgi:1-deoxy-D-xylulose-5-phosphate synthase
MVLPASQMFESLHIPYFGPVAGHDIGSLIELFEAMGELNHPVILHVYTRKGKGFRPAEWIPNAEDDVCESNQGTSKFHSTGPFKINGDRVEKAAGPSGQSFTSAFGENLTELAQHDEKIVAITSAMCDGTGLMEFSKKFPDRFYDVGIAESAAVDIAAGMARNGLKPVVCIYSTFLQRSFDHIFQEVALQNLPVVFCIDRAGFVGSDGPTHHGLMDIGFLRMMPNMVLTAPANDIEMKLALEFALSEGKPVVIRYPKDIVPSKEYVRAACASPFKLGKSVTVKRSKHSAVAVVTYGNVLTEALKAASLLAEEKISIDVVNGRFAAPVDEKIISLLGQGKSIVTVEDHAIACGFGSAVLELAAEKGYSTESIRLLGAPRRFIGHDTRDVQLMEAGANAETIAKTVRKILKA